MKPIYDFLKTTSKKGGISLSAEWLKENLGIEKGDTIISVSIGGKVLLTRFNPDIAIDTKTLELLASDNRNNSVNEKESELIEELSVEQSCDYSEDVEISSLDKHSGNE